MADDTTAPGGSENAQQAAAAPEPKTFTQEQVNSLLADEKRRVRSSFADYDTLREKAQQYDEHKAATATDQERAQMQLQQAVEKARGEARAETLRESSERTAKALLKATLSSRGKKPDEVEEILSAFSPGAFIKDGEADTDRIAAFGERLAGPTSSALPDFGQGRRGAPSQVTDMNQLIRASARR